MDLMLDCDISMKEELENMDMDLNNLSSIDLDKELVKLESIEDFEGLEVENSAINDTGQQVMAWLNSNTECETLMVNPSTVIPVSFSTVPGNRSVVVVSQPGSLVPSPANLPVVSLGKFTVGANGSSVNVRSGNSVVLTSDNKNITKLSNLTRVVRPISEAKRVSIVPSSVVNATTVHIPVSRVQIQNLTESLTTANNNNIKTSVSNMDSTIITTTTESGEKVYPKPAYSYSCLIAMALRNSNTGSLPVSEIYNFMCEHFPYFKTAPNGWKNSVRHNLSLNKCFEKIEKPSCSPSTTTGSSRKGCLWALNPAKANKMEEEVVKWTRKDPLAIKKAMANPDYLELLEKGEMKIDLKGESNTIRINCSTLDSEGEETGSIEDGVFPEFKTTKVKVEPIDNIYTGATLVKAEPIKVEPENSYPGRKLYELLGEDPPGHTGAPTLLSDPNMSRAASNTPPPDPHYLFSMDNNNRHLIRLKTSL